MRWICRLDQAATSNGLLASRQPGGQREPDTVSGSPRFAGGLQFANIAERDERIEVIEAAEREAIKLTVQAEAEKDSGGGVKFYGFRGGARGAVRTITNALCSAGSPNGCYVVDFR